MIFDFWLKEEWEYKESVIANLCRAEESPQNVHHPAKNVLKLDKYLNYLTVEDLDLCFYSSESIKN